MKSGVEVYDLKLSYCANWQRIVKAFNAFPSPKTEVDIGDFFENAWIFRGHSSTNCLLAPSIERAAKRKSVSWALLESLMLEEFRARASMHVDARSLPPKDDRLAWLALMQHYGVPTRLLDFTYSPYVALYFAIRNFVNWRPRESDKAVAYVIGINARRLAGEAGQTYLDAYTKVESYENKRRKGSRRKPVAAGRTRLNPDSFCTDSEVWRLDRQGWQEVLSDTLSPHSIWLGHFNDRGFVSIAETTMQNPRLSSQQGIFLLNGAERHSLRASLFKMMNNSLLKMTNKGKEEDWCRCFAVPGSVLPSIERKLFQMNIHELSLFPDIEGLAGFLRQRARLHWDPDDPSDREGIDPK